MKLTLIRIPEMVPHGSNALTTPPVGLAYLAAYARQRGHEVKVIDGLGEALDRYAPIFEPRHGVSLHGLSLEEVAGRIDSSYAQVIGLSIMFSQDYPVARRLVAQIRARFPGALLVAGGEHVTAAPEFTLRDGGIDLCVLGEGELTLGELLDVVGSQGRPAAHNRAAYLAIDGLAFLEEQGAYRQTSARRRMDDVDALPYPAWDLIPMESYLASGSGFGVDKGRNMPIVASRGCPYECTFCSNPQMWTQRWISRDPVKLVDEIEHWIQTYRATNFDFYDLTAIVRKDWVLTFCRELDRRRISITWQLPSGTRSEALDAETLGWMKRTGCCHIVYAPETGSERTLERIKKKVHLDRMKDSMRSAVEAGLFVKMNIVIGFPDDTPADLWHTFRFLVKTAQIGVHDVFIYPFTPYPGSELFARLHREGTLAELSEDYFLGLTSYVDLKKTRSFSAHLSDAALGRSQLGGLLLFYGLTFLLHPSRFLLVARNLRKGRQDMRIEGPLAALLGRAGEQFRGPVSWRRDATTIDTSPPGDK